MAHFIVLIIQLFFLTLYILCKIFDWPGVVTFSIFSWILPIGFYFIQSIITFFKKQYWLTLTYFLFVFLILCIPTKIYFIYHNVILQFFIISSFLFLLYKRSSLELDKYFKAFIILVVSINVFFLFLSDNFVYDKLGANYLFKSYSNQPLNWENFNKVDSIEGGFEASIDTYIAYRINKAFNYTSATAIAKVEIENTYYVEQSDELLEHELYHFKITEIVTRKLNNALSNYHFGRHEETKKIIYQYLDTLYNMQKAYDTETNHNLNTSKQLEWKTWVDKELNK